MKVVRLNFIPVVYIEIVCADKFTITNLLPLSLSRANKDGGTG